MEFLKNIKAKLILGLITLVGILFYILNLKDKKIIAHQAELQLADTKEKVKDIERDIRVKMDEHREDKKQLEKLEASLAKLEEKKAKMAEVEGIDAEEYWSKN